MSKKNTTYVELKYLPSKKKMEKEKIKEQVIYSEVKASTSNSNQAKITRTKSSKGKASSVPFIWRLAVLILGILCFLLLLTTGILGVKVFQAHQQLQSQKSPLDNKPQKDNSMFKNKTIKEEPLNTGNKCSTCENKWSCCRKQCYYFSNKQKTFEESKKACKKMDSMLLKIDDEKELKFIQSQLSYFFWIGLSRKRTNSSWKWEDDSQPIPKMLSNWQESGNGNCARMAATKTEPFDCSKPLSYVCEKQIALLAS